MREIKFRGRRVDNGEWVEGSLITKITPKEVEPVFWATLIHDGALTAVEVDPATVGQFTGLIDKNGREIYEGDVVDSWAGLEDNTKTYLRKVIYRECGLEFEPMTGYTLCKANEKLFEVIGDIFNNPELIA